MTGNNCKVLVVDDMPDVLTTIKGWLEDSGYLVTAAAREEQAKNILQQQEQDFVVIDIGLQEGTDDESGVALARTIRSWGVHSKIIFITGRTVRESYVKAVIEFGVVDFIVKEGDWVNRVQNTIEQHFRKFDVFLCHNSEDKPAVKVVGEELKNRGLRPWLDEWELRPGFPWQRTLEDEIERIPAAAVFVGRNNIGPWQQMELDGFLREFVERDKPCPVIPVILPDCITPPRLPVFLRGMTWVDFRKSDPDPMQQLIWGITGKK